MLDTAYQACYNHYKLRDITNKGMNSVDHFCTQLKAQGRRVTPQRRAIIQALVENHSHPTAEQVLTRVRGNMPNLSPATVYNTLHELVDIGVLQELDLGLGERHYDVFPANHAHLVCSRCGRIEDVPCNSEALMPSSEHMHGFLLKECNVVFRGYCPACASQREEDAGANARDGAS
jgi:Fe2+ or Zn2+ uptake regulation protein